MGEGNAEPRSGKRGPVLQRTCPQCESKVPASKKRCPACGAHFVLAKQNREAAREADAAGFGAERAAVSKGVLGGIVLLVVAGVWFYVGWQAGYIYYYPPVLALIGVYAIWKGISEGNLAGSPRPPATRGRRRR